MSQPNAKIAPAIDSTAKGETVARRRFQRGSVYKNRSKTVWLGAYAEYMLAPNGEEKRKRRTVVFCTVRKPNGSELTKREAQRLLQPYVDRINSSLANPTRELKTATLESFMETWVRDYLST
jgi:hypothetical protein